MTRELFSLFIGLIVINPIAAYWVSISSIVSKNIARETRMLGPFVGVVGILFGLFAGFNSAEIGQREAGLKLATQREVSAGRSLLNLTSGVGPSAKSIQDAALEYLQTVTTAEKDWLSTGAKGEAPGYAPVYSLALSTTLFAEKAKSADVVKALMMSHVDELINARTERLTRMTGKAAIPLWGALTIMALTVQWLGAIALSGGRFQTSSFLLAYTLVTVVCLSYLAWAGRLIGANQIEDQLAPFALLLEHPQWMN